MSGREETEPTVFAYPERPSKEVDVANPVLIFDFTRGVVLQVGEPRSDEALADVLTSQHQAATESPPSR